MTQLGKDVDEVMRFIRVRPSFSDGQPEDAIEFLDTLIEMIQEDSTAIEETMDE